MTTLASGPASTPSIEVCHAHVHKVWRARLAWRAGLTIAQALRESGFLAAHPGWDRARAGVGIDGTLAGWDDEIAPHVRIEVYRPLDFDPMVSRRRRAEHRAREARGQTGRKR
ncbi:MAG: RnfH family protein [Burkholderiaceae bacterium]|nr:RnfH family protein [Burkholderiaceae bacterium]